MAESPKRPSLRVVGQEEVGRQEAPAPTPASAAPAESPPSSERLAFDAAAEDVDATSPRKATLLVRAGLHLARGALEGRHRASNHAPAGTFRRGVTPGEKAAEAQLALLEAHLEEARGGKPRGADLLRAAQGASREVDLTWVVGSSVGLDLSDFRREIFGTAMGLLPERTAAEPESDYLLLATCSSPSQGLSPVGCAFLGGLVGGAIVAMLLA